MSKTCPKCGSDGNGKPAPKESRYWCSSSAWENGDFYQSPECVRRERDNLLDRVKELKSYAERLEKSGDTLATVTLRNGRSHDQWHAAKETNP